MQYTITISQTKAIEWELNAQQALLFAFIYEVPSWAKPVRIDGGIFYALSKAKIIEELPLLTEKPDTAYRLLKQLEAAGVIELSHTAGITLVRLTDKGRGWNRKEDGSEKYPNQAQKASEKNPSEVGKKSEVGRKKIRGRSEKNPTNHDTSHVTSQETSQYCSAAADEIADELIAAAEQAKRSARKATLDLSAFPEQPSPQVWADYLQHRKTKRAAVTQTVINTLAKELAIAAAAGWSVDDALAEAMAAGWQGLKAAWLMNRSMGSQARPAGRMSRQAAIEENNRQAGAEFVAEIMGVADAR